MRATVQLLARSSMTHLLTILYSNQQSGTHDIVASYKSTVETYTISPCCVSNHHPSSTDLQKLKGPTTPKAAISFPLVWPKSFVLNQAQRTNNCQAYNFRLQKNKKHKLIITKIHVLTRRMYNIVGRACVIDPGYDFNACQFSTAISLANYSYIALCNDFNYLCLISKWVRA